MHKDRIFFNCFCYGAAATTWLARMLNCHEDFLCLHTPEYPDCDTSNEDYLYKMADYTYSSTALGGPPYKYIGFTHGIPYTGLGRLEKMFGKDKLRAFVMIRHPIARARSIMALRGQQATIHNMYRPAQSLEHFYNMLLEKSGRTGFATDYESLCFYEVCAQLIGAITREKATGVPIFTMEALTSSPAEINKLLGYISDGNAQLDEEIIARVQKRPIGKHAKKTLTPQDIFDSWSDDWKTAFYALLGEDAINAYQSFGYELPARS